MAYPLDLNKKLNIAHIDLCTEAEGPYRRMAVWFQGCNIMCEGCCNPELQDLRAAHIITVRDVLDIALRSRTNNNIEGVTFLGGEPTIQEGMAHLANALSMEGLGVILFTGNKYECLDASVIDAVDMIIDGRFDPHQPDGTRNLIGSKNQRIIFVTDRYKDSIDWFLTPREKRVEINISEALFISGDVI